MDGKNYFALPISEIYCYENDDKKIVSPYHIIGKPIYEQVEAKIFIPNPRQYPDYVEVIYTPPPIEDANHPLYQKLKLGDKLICHKSSTYKLEINKKEYLFVLPQYVVAINEVCVNGYIFLEPFDIKNDYVLKNNIYIKEKELHQKGFAIIRSTDPYGKFAVGDKVYYLKKIKYKHPLKRDTYYSRMHNIYLHDRTTD